MEAPKVPATLKWFEVVKLLQLNRQSMNDERIKQEKKYHKLVAWHSSRDT